MLSSFFSTAFIYCS